MRPTEIAELEFWHAVSLAGNVLHDDSAPEYAKQLAIAIAGLGSGLKQMSIGLRATYMLIEDTTKRNDG